jgi:hypothetical protein
MRYDPEGITNQTAALIRDVTPQSRQHKRNRSFTLFMPHLNFSSQPPPAVSPECHRHAAFHTSDFDAAEQPRVRQGSHRRKAEPRNLPEGKPQQASSIHVCPNDPLLSATFLPKKHRQTATGLYQARTRQLEAAKQLRVLQRCGCRVYIFHIAIRNRRKPEPRALPESQPQQQRPRLWLLRLQRGNDCLVRGIQQVAVMLCYSAEDFCVVPLQPLAGALVNCVADGLRAAEHCVEGAEIR